MVRKILTPAGRPTASSTNASSLLEEKPLVVGFTSSPSARAEPGPGQAPQAGPARVRDRDGGRQLRRADGSGDGSPVPVRGRRGLRGGRPRVSRPGAARARGPVPRGIAGRLHLRQCRRRPRRRGPRHGAHGPGHGQPADPRLLRLLRGVRTQPLRERVAAGSLLRAHGDAGGASGCTARSAGSTAAP